jgi:hypothetical protein
MNEFLSSAGQDDDIVDFLGCSVNLDSVTRQFGSWPDIVSDFKSFWAQGH